MTELAVTTPRIGVSRDAPGEAGMSHARKGGRQR